MNDFDLSRLRYGDIIVWPRFFNVFQTSIKKGNLTFLILPFYRYLYLDLYKSLIAGFTNVSLLLNWPVNKVLSLFYLETLFK